MTKIAIIALVLFAGLAAFPGLTGTWTAVYDILQTVSHGQNPFVFKVLAALPQIFLVGLFVMPLIGWWQAKTSKKDTWSK